MARSTDDVQQVITQVMKKYGARGTPDEFHAAVNVTFHNFESQVYDEIHSDMWASLPQQFALLVRDCLREYPDAPQKIRVLDIGSGTGLASDSLLRTDFGPRVTSIDLLDTSPSMLKQATLRSSQWRVPVQPRNGLVDDLPETNQYELIITCSVLHHVPDLQAFCATVRRHQAPGGIFLHLQDPNAVYLKKNAPKPGSRMQRRAWEQLSRFTPSRIFGRLAREVTGRQGQDYISKTNRALLEAGVIARPLKVEDLYAITDIHVIDGRGLSLEAIGGWLPDYVCISRRSYGFFGKLPSELPQRLRAEEDALTQKNELTGAEIAAAWRLKGSSAAY